MWTLSTDYRQEASAVVENTAHAYNGYSEQKQPYDN